MCAILTFVHVWLILTPVSYTHLDETYMITEDKNGDPVTPHVNWKKALPKKPNEDEQSAFESLYETNPVKMCIRDSNIMQSLVSISMSPIPMISRPCLTD